MDANTLQLVGEPYPEDINEKSGKAQRKILLKYEGEKHCCRRVDIHIRYKFPVYDDTKFVLENTVWEVINREYDQWCVNDVYGLYHTESEDSLEREKSIRIKDIERFITPGCFIRMSFSMSSFIISVSRYILLTLRAVLCSLIFLIQR